MTDKFICSLPWKHLSIMPHGVSSICCVADHSKLSSRAMKKGITLNVSTTDIHDIVNSDTYKQIRLDMLNGKIPEACATCKKVEDVGGLSKRLREGLSAEDFDTKTHEDGSIIPDLEDVELRLGNYCNLKCRGCNAESSTSWIGDYYKLKDQVPLPSGFHFLKQDPSTDYSWCESEKFYSDLLKHSRSIKRIHISGGEPFLVDKHTLLLQKLIDEKLNENLQIFYISNLNYSFSKVKPILDLLTKFSQVYISFSIDDVGERNSYFRSLSDWNLTIENLRNFYQRYPDFRYSITQTVNVFNFLYIEELQNFLNENGLYRPIIYNSIHAPEYLSVNVLPIEIRQKKLDSIKDKVIDYQILEGRYYNAPQLDQSKIQDFLRVTEALDKIRNEDFRKTFPLLKSFF